MGDDTILEARGKGSMKATMQVGGRMLFTTITQVFHVPKMKNSFMSVNKLISEGLKVEFDKDGCKVNNAHGTIVRKHEGRRTCIFSMSMFERRVRMWQTLRMKKLCFSTKDSGTSTWRALQSWRKWSMA
jgi:hypothetical protein